MDNELVKKTYRINKDLIKKMGHIKIDASTTYDKLIEEAIQDLIKKYSSKKH